jgi:hypothetical protein
MSYVPCLWDDLWLKWPLERINNKNYKNSVVEKEKRRRKGKEVGGEKERKKRRKEGEKE